MSWDVIQNGIKMKFNRLIRKSPQLSDIQACVPIRISSTTIEDYFGRKNAFDNTITSDAFDGIRAGKWKAFPFPLIVFNPETMKAENVFVNVIELLLKCSRLL